MIRGRAAFGLLGLVLLAGCARSSAPPHSSAADSAAAVAFAPSVNAFGCELYRALTETTSGNITISPLSLSTCLGMACVGARGATQDEMERVLHLSGDFTSGYRALRGRVAAEPLEVTNRLWVQKGAGVLADYQATLRDDFGSSAATMDFADDPEGSRQKLNRWFSDQTKGRIGELLPAGSIDAATFAVLGNAVYFVGKWKEPFKHDGTHPDLFHLNGDSTITMSMMHWSGERALARLPGARMVELDYIGGLSFLVVLPDSVDGLYDLERHLTADSLATWCARLAPLRMELALPKFTARSASMLAGTLEALGMETAFNTSADFTGISARKPLSLGVVAHQAFVQVDEEGTVAAAATAARVTTTATRVLEEIEFFYVDHPFVFAIRDRATGCLLFLGRFTGTG
jgi:serpin B